MSESSNKAPDRTERGGFELKKDNPESSKDRDNWVVAHPLPLRWDDMRWEPKRAVKNRPMITPEARISRLQSWRVSNQR